MLLEYNREDVMNLVQLERIVVGVGFDVESREPRAESREARAERCGSRLRRWGAASTSSKPMPCAERRWRPRYQVVPFEAVADVYVINTCTITAEADADSRQLTRRAVRRNPAALVVMTGCYAQAAPEAAAAIPGVDLVVGNVEKSGLLAEIQRVRKNGAARVRVGDIGGATRIDGDEYGPGIDPDRTRAFLKVQDGCNYACSFCIVPSVRGPNRSQSPAAVLAAIRRLHAAGFPEVVLTGIHLGTYGRDLTPRTTLVALCEAIAALPDGPRVRLSSLDPHEVTPELIRLLGGSPRFCRHLHLPVQSGDEDDPAADAARPRRGGVPDTGRAAGGGRAGDRGDRRRHRRFPGRGRRGVPSAPSTSWRRCRWRASTSSGTRPDREPPPPTSRTASPRR